jgi:hypothetical protein
MIMLVMPIMPIEPSVAINHGTLRVGQRRLVRRFRDTDRGGVGGGPVTWRSRHGRIVVSKESGG